jgi:hypothetical protein
MCPSLKLVGKFSDLDERKYYACIIKLVGSFLVAVAGFKSVDSF